MGHVSVESREGARWVGGQMGTLHSLKKQKSKLELGFSLFATLEGITDLTA